MEPIRKRTENKAWATKAVAPWFRKKLLKISTKFVFRTWNPQAEYSPDGKLILFFSSVKKGKKLSKIQRIQVLNTVKMPKNAIMFRIIYIKNQEERQNLSFYCNKL